jgi:hypothetical protein
MKSRARVNPISVKRKDYEAELDDAKEKVQERSGGYCEALTIAIWYLGANDPNGALDALQHGIRCNGRAVHVHHRKYRSRGGSNGLSNLAHLSEPCHTWVHAHPELSNILGLSLHANESETL